jgi:hypothetical protein
MAKGKSGGSQALGSPHTHGIVSVANHGFHFLHFLPGSRLSLQSIEENHCQF